MAKRFSEKEKRSTVSKYVSSGQSCTAYAQVCGVTAVTLRAWHKQFADENQEGGFIAISAPLRGESSGFRLEFGEMVLDFEHLPPVEWVLTLHKSLTR